MLTLKERLEALTDDVSRLKAAGPLSKVFIAEQALAHALELLTQVVACIDELYEQDETDREILNKLDNKVFPEDDMHDE